MRNALALAIAALACLTVGLATAQKHQTKPKPKAPTYASVKPIFDKCAMCHSGKRPKHGLDLTSYANVMKGDREGKVVVAGKPAESRLSKAVHRKGAAPMPPAGALPGTDVAKIDAWIKAGAKS